jgi:hypothetical protein
LRTFTYHFGFHAAVSVFHWFTGIDIIQVVLWVGQILNGLAVLALYPLAMRICRNRWGGVWAVLLAGLLSPMPMFYVNWGRYTQLAGQVILPAAVIVSWAAFEEPRRDWRLIALAWIAVGGLALTHFRVLIFYILFVVSWILISMRKETWWENLLRLTWVGSGAALLFLPWFIHTFAGNITRIFLRQLSTTRPSAFMRQHNALGALSFYLAPVWWLTLPIGVGLGLWRRKKAILLTALWWSLLFIATNPELLSLPGTGAITNHALFMAAYIPVALFTGYLMIQLVSPLERWTWIRVTLVVVFVGVGLWGVRERMGDLAAPQHALVSIPDLQAMAWIRENTPLEAKFLVNSFFAYGGSVIVGSDGGWWIPLLAGRKNTVPPLNYGSEMGWEPDYLAQVNELARRVQGANMDEPEVLELLRQNGITHIYIGQRQGRVNYNGEAVLRPDELKKSPHYEVVYHRDRVWIFALRKGEK